MASKIIGIAVLTAPQLANSDPSKESRLMYFDANFWIADSIQLLACVRYYNDMNHCFKQATTCVIEATIARMNMDPKFEGMELSEDERKEYQLVGQVNWLIPVNGTDPRSPPFIYVASIVKNAAKELATFSVEGSQWMHAFQHDQALAKLPVRVVILKNL
ncbi:hypothetical protein BDN71DRAFT_1511570 [Pleurotus eryngii]|uniref:Uncharacterized protein n=1 Tax=Pleurotus eryngii TaxID=5323 RepID=A0A9P6DAV3_PLEER|nr:hypothetical protein BDN71DRAFT_1511570 [Pleurotus eryngii]